MNAVNELPTTTVALAPESRTELRTFLIADVRGYTRFTQEQGDEAAARLVTKFAAIVRETAGGRSGKMIELHGDEATVVFGSTRQALRAALDLQMRFSQESESDPSLPLPVGIGLDAGEAVALENGYRGEALNVAARLCNLAGPGEVLASEGVIYLGRRVPGLVYATRGVVAVKGYADPVRVIKVVREEDAGQGLEEVTVADLTELPLPIGGFLGALPAGVMVGRAAEWEQIMACLESVLQGSGRLLLLSGEPGIGKTRLAQELTLKARHWGFLVATGRCYETEQAVPFYPFLEILASIYHASSAYIRSEIPRRWPYLARLLSEDIEDSGSAKGPADGRSLLFSDAGSLEQEDQQRLFRAVTGFLEMVSETMPLAILIDDLHWTDEASLKLLQHLTRYTRGSRVLLLGTYRNVEVHRHHPLETAVLDLSREMLVQEVEVRRLDRDGTAGLMAEVMGENEDLEDLVDLIHRRTEGNAFFIQEVMRTLVERGDVFRKDGRWERRAISVMEVPKSIRSAIGQRISHLDERSQEILHEASVLGQEFLFDDLMALAALSISAPDGRAWTEDEVEVALQHAARGGIVRESKADNFAFDHSLIQQTLYSELSTRRRKRLHLAAGRALQDAGDRPGRRGSGGRERRAAELEWHFLEGDDGERALPYALIAGDQAEQVFANGDAERHFRIAVELAGELGDRTRLIESLQKLSGVLTIVGRYDEALELLERAAQLCREGNDIEGEACIVALIGHTHYLRRTSRMGIERLKPLVESLEGAKASYGLAALWAAYARLFIGRGNDREELAAAERAVELATQLGDDERATRLLIGAEVTRSDALWSLGQGDDAIRMMEEMIPRAEAAGDLDNLARALSNAADYYGWRGEFDKDRTYNERMLEVAEQRGDRGYILLGSTALSANAFLAGDWEQARRYLDRAESTVRSLRAPALSIWPVLARAWLSFREGDSETASRLARSTLSMAEDLGLGSYIRSSRRLLAEIELQVPGPEAAQKALRHLEPMLDRPHAQQDSDYLRTLAWAYMENGDLERALSLATQGVNRAREIGSQPELVEALVVRGTVLFRRKSWDEAEWDFAEALSLSQGMPFPFGEGLALRGWGMMMAMQGDATGSRQRLARAKEIFAGLGAAKLAERTIVPG
ncbi:MAG: ATP-binding protein [Chloroflexota bacterium]